MLYPVLSFGVGLYVYLRHFFVQSLNFTVYQVEITFIDCTWSWVLELSICFMNKLASCIEAIDYYILQLQLLKYSTLPKNAFGSSFMYSLLLYEDNLNFYFCRIEHLSLCCLGILLFW